MSAGSSAPMLGVPHLHFRRLDSTNRRARILAAGGAPHGTLVTADEQTAGRGRQGRSWVAPSGQALLMTVLLRQPPDLLPLVAAVALCDAVGDGAGVKWPNDVVRTRPEALCGDGPALTKLAGVLVEGRPQQGWAVVGMGVNVAVQLKELPVELRRRAATLGLSPDQVGPIRDRVLDALRQRLSESGDAVLEAWRAYDALYGREVCWAGGHGEAHGVDSLGRLIVLTAGGGRRALVGEVHLRSGCADDGREGAG